MKLAISLLILADKMCCEEAINLCLRITSEKLDIYRLNKMSKSDNWKLLIEEKTLSGETRAKLLGLLLEKKIEESKKIKDGIRSINNNEMSVIAKELVNFKI